MRNTPVMTWIGLLDEGSTPDRQTTSSSNLQKEGLRFVFDQFPAADHLTLATNDEYSPLVEFLETPRLNPDPSHVTFVVQTKRDSARAKTVADHAYWLSGLKLRNTESPDGSVVGPSGQIDAYSQAFGLGPAMAKGAVTSMGVLQGGAHGPTPYIRSSQELDPPAKTQAMDTLVVTAKNIASMTVDVRRARLSCNPIIKATSDGPLSILLKGCDRVVQVGAAQ
jgi:hypothetical protein